jgi:DNA invertase Pin-like site-specific DNA recombinase
MKKAAIMARVSSEEQANGYSLDSQIDQLRRYCDLKDIEIVYEFREEHSAKTFERPAFKDFLRIAKKHKGMFDS